MVCKKTDTDTDAETVPDADNDTNDDIRAGK